MSCCHGGKNRFSRAGGAAQHSTGYPALFAAAHAQHFKRVPKACFLREIHENAAEVSQLPVGYFLSLLTHSRIDNFQRTARPAAQHVGVAAAVGDHGTKWNRSGWIIAG